MEHLDLSPAHSVPCLQAASGICGDTGLRQVQPFVVDRPQTVDDNQDVGLGLLGAWPFHRCSKELGVGLHMVLALVAEAAVLVVAGVAGALERQGQREQQKCQFPPLVEAELRFRLRMLAQVTGLRSRVRKNSHVVAASSGACAVGPFHSRPDSEHRQETEDSSLASFLRREQIM